MSSTLPDIGFGQGMSMTRDDVMRLEGLRVVASVHARFDGDEMDFEVVEISGGDEA